MKIIMFKKKTTTTTNKQYQLENLDMKRLRREEDKKDEKVKGRKAFFKNIQVYTKIRFLFNLTDPGHATLVSKNKFSFLKGGLA